MATSKEFRDFVLERMNHLKGITCRPMMGEYLLYYNGVLFGGIYDERVLIKINSWNQNFGMPEQIPYPNAKPMYYLTDIENKDLVKNVVLETCKGFPIKVKK